jgi:hypothetical protein
MGPISPTTAGASAVDRAGAGVVSGEPRQELLARLAQRGFMPV